MTGDRYGQAWTEDEATLALYLYCQIPFQKTKANNPAVQALAAHLGRTPASVARKLGNFGSFDPLLAERNIVGLAHTAKIDSDVWTRYQNDWASLVDVAVSLWSEIAAATEPALGPPTRPATSESTLPSGPSQTRRLVNVRLHQAFFRRAVLTSYDAECCACGIDLPELLTASHIVPWAENEALRADPSNGLCLCALHDRAFDRGLIAVSPEGRIMTSEKIKRSRSEAAWSYLAILDGAFIRRPRRFLARPEYLDWHRSNVFRLL